MKHTHITRLLLLLIASSGWLFGSNAYAQNEFITTWQTTTVNEGITIPTNSSLSNNYDIDWGDGTFQSGITGDATHQYTSPGIHTIKISGDLQYIYINNNSAIKDKILTIEQWGNIQWTTMTRAFFGCTNLTINAMDAPDLSGVTNMSYMFQQARSINSDLSNWDVSNVTNMLQTFAQTDNFNGDITTWDVSNVDNMYGMFAETFSFQQPINSWDVSNVTTMLAMFKESNFNRDISNWNVSKVTDFSQMFKDNGVFNMNVKNWDISSATNLAQMFDGAFSFNQDLSDWNITNVTNMNELFDNSALSTNNYDNTINSWSLQSVQSGVSLGALGKHYCNSGAARAVLEGNGWNFNDAGQLCLSFNTTWETTSSNESITIPTFSGETYSYDVDWGDGSTTLGETGDATHQYSDAGTYIVSISGTFPRIYFNNTGDRLKIKSIEQWGNIVWSSMERAFYGCENISMPATDVPNLWYVNSLFRTFSGASAFDGDLSNWDVSKVTSMFGTFAGADVFNSNIGNWKVSGVTTMQYMFDGASSFNQDISNWDVGNVLSMRGMFFNVTNFNQPLDSWNVSKVTTMRDMFMGTSMNQPLNSWDVSEVTSMINMFRNISQFNQDLSSWEIGNVTDMSQMFDNSGLSTLNYDKILQGWATKSVKPGVTLGAANIDYCEGASARAILEGGPNNWIINDGDENCIINIPDTNFKAALLANSSINTDGNTNEISVQEAEAVSGLLDVNNQGIADLTGIEYFTGVTDLRIQDNNLTSIDISNNTGLQGLTAWGNNITSIDISSNVALNTLQLQDNGLTNIDVTNNPLLTNLRLSGNLLSSIDISNNPDLIHLVINGNTALSSLNVSNNSLIESLIITFTNISSVNFSHLPNLRDLRAHNTLITSIDLSGNPDVYYLHINNLNLESLDLRNGNNEIITGINLTNNPNLSCISVDNPAYSKANWTSVDDPNFYKITCNPDDIVNIPDPVLKTALLNNSTINTTDDGEIRYGEAESYLGEINVQDNGLSDATGIEAFSNVSEITLHGSLTSIDVSNNSSITKLDLENNNITNLDVSYNLSLRDLWLQNNDLSSLDVSNLAELRHLRIHGTDISSIDLANNTLLQNLLISNTPITNIDVSNNPNLSTFWAQNGLFSILDFSDNPLLSSLWLENCDNLTQLDLRNNPLALFFRVDKSDNLIALDLRNGNNENMSSFNSEDTPNLTCISVDDPIFSNNNWINKDASNEFKFSCDPSEVVNIPDINFKTALLANSSINTTNDGDITYGEAEAYTGVIDVSSLGITDLTGIEAFSNINELLVHSNTLATLDTRYNPLLTKLWAWDNNLTSINLSFNSDLVDLTLNDNTLSSIDLDANTDLINLQLENCGLSNGIDVSQLTQLTALNVRSNGLSSIDLSNLIVLSNLRLEFNALTSLNLSSNTAITQLRVSNNNLISLDLTGLGSLTTLYADNTLINDLNISGNSLVHTFSVKNSSLASLNVANGNNTNFVSFDVLNNPNLSCITVDDVNYSTSNWTSIDGSANFSTDCNNVENDILTFSLAEQLSPATIDATNHEVDIEVVFGTPLGNLSPTYTVSSGAISDPSSGVAQDFTSNFIYTVTAENPTAIQDWTINVQEENVAPTDISLSATAIDENNVSGTVVGALTSTDANAVSSHNYSLVSGSGDTDNASFSISNSNIIASSSFDFETKSSYSVRIQTDDGRGGTFSKAFTITVNDITGETQTITIDPIPAKSTTDVPFDIIATSDSGLPVSLSITGPATLTNKTITLSGAAGDIVITATNAGDTDYASASATLSVPVTKVDQTITLDAIESKVFGEAPFNLSGASSSSLPLTYTVVSGPATIADETLTLSGAGTVVISASQEGNDTYNSATLEQTITVAKAEQTITLTPIESKVFGDADFELSATASSGLDVTYSIVSGPATISGATVSLTGAGEVIIEASQTGDDNYAAATSVSETFTIDKSEQTLTFETPSSKLTTDAPFDVIVTSSSGLTPLLTVNGPATVSGSTVTLTGDEGTVTVTASQPGDENYNAATNVDVRFDVVSPQESQNITFPEIEDQYLEDGSVILSATASSGLEVTYEIIEGPATLGGTTLTFTGLGEVTVEATQEGNDAFFPADPVQITFEIISITGLNTIEISKISIYPNPTEGQLTLEMNVKSVNELSVYDLNGIKVLNVDINKNIDVSSLNPGLYFLLIRENSGKVNQLKFNKK